MAACLEMTGGFDLIDKSESVLKLQQQDFEASDRKNHVSINSYDMLSRPSLEVAEVEYDVKGAKDIDSSAVKESENNSNLHSSQRSIVKPSKKNLRVTFPEGNEVSGYMDPPIPWDDVSSCTTEVLVSSYLKSCEKFGVRPIQKLLSQLQAIANFQERNETLTLRNDHLDYRHCETLEEVLRRVQFRTIDLESTKMDDEAAVVMFDMVEYYESCVKLNISFSRSFGARGWQACARLIKKTSSLEQLDAQGCNIADHLVPFVGRALKASTSLVSLHLENTSMSGKSLATLAMILKTNETLRKLHLAYNKITPSDAVQIASLIKFNKNIKLLDLRNNHLQDVGMGHLCEGISEQGSPGIGLETLVVWNNQLTYQSMSLLSKALTDTKSLQDLNLGRNNITNEGIHRLKDGLLKNRSLLVIRLQAARISCEGAVAIAEYLAETTKLSRIDLRDNDIKTGGLMALSLALKVNKSMLRVDLDKEPKKENGVKDYVDQQKNLLVDIFSCIDRNDKLVKMEEKKTRENDATRSEIEVGVFGPVEMSSPSLDVSSHLNGEEWSLVEFTKGTLSIKSSHAIEDQAPLLTNIANSNNSSRSKLRLELHPSPDALRTSDEDCSGEPGASPESKLALNIPLSPVVVSQGTASLIPVKSNGIFSPEELNSSMTDFSIQATELPTCEHFESTRLLSENQGFATATRVSKCSKRSGKMSREKHKKFVVTKTMGHHCHQHSIAPGSKRMSSKNSKRQSNVPSDVFAFDGTAASVAEGNLGTASRNDPDPRSMEVDRSETSSTPSPSDSSDFRSDPLDGASNSDDSACLDRQMPDVVPSERVEGGGSSPEEKMENFSMNGLLKAETPDKS